MNAWPREKWHCDNSELLLVHLVELVLVKDCGNALIAFAGLDHLFRPLFIVSEKLLMNQSGITKNEGLMARIGIFRTSTLSMNARSLTIVVSIIALKILSLSPALACDPYLYSGDFEDMLKDGESQEIVLDSMKNSIGYTGNSCYFEFKKYVKKNRSKFPNFYIMLTD